MAYDPLHMAAPFRVIVLGASVQAFACACELAISGASVAIVQTKKQREMSQGVRARGFSFDTCETMITRPEILKSLFLRTGREMEDYLALAEIDPFIRFWFDDGVIINVRREAGQFARQLDQQFPLDRQGANYCNLVIAQRENELAAASKLMNSHYSFANEVATLARPAILA